MAGNTTNLPYRNGKRPGRKGYGIDIPKLENMFHLGIPYKEIASDLNISIWTVLDRLEKLDLKRSKRYPVVNPDVFAKMDASAAYWAGFLAADGWIYKDKSGFGLQLARKDEEHLIKLCKFIGREPSIYRAERIKDGKVYLYSSIGVCNKQIVNDLFKFFKLVPAKSLILEPPDLPTDIIRHFIRAP